MLRDRGSAPGPVTGKAEPKLCFSVQSQCFSVHLSSAGQIHCSVLHIAQVLDIAGGTGDMSLLVQKKLSGTGEVWLSDINHEMLKIGDERLKNAGYHPYVLTCDAEYLPFPDGYFDVLIVSFGLRNMKHKDRALREMQRVLKPGGRLMVLEFSKPVALMRPFYDFYSFKVMPFLSAKIAGHSENYRYLAESIRMHPDQKTLAKIMREAGFERVEWKNLTFGITALHIGYKN